MGKSVIVIPAWLSCVLNRNLCQRVRDFVVENGYRLGESIESSDFVIYAGCGVTGGTEMHSFSEIDYIMDHVDFRNTGKKFILIGCLTKQNRKTRGVHFDSKMNRKEKLIDSRFVSDPDSNYIVVDNYDLSLLDEIFDAKIPFEQIPVPTGVSSVDGTKGLYFSFRAMRNYPLKERTKLQNNFLQQAAMQNIIVNKGFFFPSVAEYLSNYGYNQVFIGQGCKNSCAYCAIKFSRDKLVSVPLEEIRKRIQELIASGQNKFVLLCQDLGSWGIDLGQKWTELITALINIDEPNLKLALFNVKAEDVLEEKAFFDRAVDSGKISYIGAMNQHVNKRVLEAMKRVPFEKEDYLNMINEYGSKNVHIHTYNIIGFPGETKKEFEELVEFVNGIKTENFSLLNFTYSDREGTLASSYGNKVPLEEIMERIYIINQAYIAVSKERFSCFESELKNALIKLTELQAEHTELNQDFIEHLFECI